MGEGPTQDSQQNLPHVWRDQTKPYPALQGAETRLRKSICIYCGAWWRKRRPKGEPCPRRASRYLDGWHHGDPVHDTAGWAHGLMGRGHSPVDESAVEREARD